ncbi:hypothetical protein B0T26DRAFT_170201 [Lasiosphaeria miniovina]|uniref:Uncharacterized protein n=1 Tax=Lasiosphaeria miniovina TaxID=1954250 RepID=A0AA40B634_9PEZI|nr:uncharacterized protein B0T26DRAFT_170201 [Lasiosphaeria miniovina]KAK0728401.1 hypothetical protein B0T26DRAFT_170201 [Lasiosphaeria miniovina]
MASLPGDHPALSLHLCDDALTPIISSAAFHSSTASTTITPDLDTASITSQTPPSGHTQIPPNNKNNNNSSSSSSHVLARQRAGALSKLAATALAAQRTASRLGLGAAVRIVIETADASGRSGAVVVNSFIESAIPSSSPSTIPSPPGPAAPLLSAPSSSGPTPVLERITPPRRGGRGSDLLAADESEISNDNQTKPPTLVAVVVAPDAEHTAEAQQAASKLELIGRHLQLAWIEEQQKTSGNDDSLD